MSFTITPEEIEHYRAELANYPEALNALDVLEDCEGDLEDASITLALQSGLEPDTSERWIDGLAKRWRHIVCQAELKESLEDGMSGDLLTALTSSTDLPMRLAILVAIFVIKTGVESFCKPLEEKIH
ncbi:hypothetical protein OsccyDRAFT_4900 [Leptolyngbyaceae cyanobacterium JSC-12]|nr:hypothetical protein OsccyDRAFT_4900 [Leptolyngbyaceae cyanobacterium JSC-12]